MLDFASEPQRFAKLEKDETRSEPRSYENAPPAMHNFGGRRKEICELLAKEVLSV